MKFAELISCHKIIIRLPFPIQIVDVCAPVSVWSNVSLEAFKSFHIRV